MMISKNLCRYLHIGAQRWYSAPVTLKSQMADLRKKTGYTFSNIKKALDLHNNDAVQAEKWLHEQAAALGWSKAIKLQGRKTTEGLVALTIRDKIGAMVEINCETDFVAKNQKFKELAETAVLACLEYSERSKKHWRCDIGHLDFYKEDIGDVKCLKSGKTLMDHLTMTISALGENMTFSKALVLKAEKKHHHIMGYTHPSGESIGDVSLGRIGGLVAMRQIERSDADLQQFGRDICQHIVGMNPKIVGTLMLPRSKDPDDEPCLVYQKYIHDENLIVDEVLRENGFQVIYFQRFECGVPYHDLSNVLKL